MINVDPIFQHKFRDESLIRLALTHRSSSGLNNERLEFLGDSILAAIVSEELIKKFPLAKEGELTKMRAALVNRKKLSQLASETDIKKFLILGEGEKKSGGWRRVSILANVLEAIIGAIFLDSSYENCRELVKARFESSFKELKDKPLLKDPKTRLQEKLQSKGLGLPIYTLDSIHGKDHDRTFIVSCNTSLFPPQIGQGNSKKNAEQQAAEAVLCLIN
ncbi:MAG: ribonuclease III [Methylococcaceae bacterium TMED69]|nr:MAG: ribonuclease III [Methylococcaceae bacterium TMED69]